jgi:hypothetical protein
MIIALAFFSPLAKVFNHRDAEQALGADSP